MAELSKGLLHRIIIKDTIFNKFIFEVIKNKHQYNNIKEPYLLIIKMKDDDSFVCCGLTELEKQIFVEQHPECYKFLEPQKSVYAEIEEILKANPEAKTITIDSYEILGGKK